MLWLGRIRLNASVGRARPGVDCEDAPSVFPTRVVMFDLTCRMHSEVWSTATVVVDAKDEVGRVQIGSGCIESPRRFAQIVIDS